MTAPLQTFPPETLEAMFQAIEMDDVVDPEVSLPDPIPAVSDEAMMRSCLALATQFWRENVDRGQMCSLVDALLLSGDLPHDARVRYKHIRAAYKQMRFALVLYGRTHKAPLLFRLTVATMGHLQDAFRNRRRWAVTGYALALRILLSPPVWLAVRREIGNVKLDDARGFRDFHLAEFGRLRGWLAGGSPTGHRFHMMRKVISRQVAFYDTMRTLQPDERVYRMSRFLSAINGLMGSLHDDLVEQVGAGQRDYHEDDVPLPHDIAHRLEALVAHNPFPAV
ncbi:hypothetical protein WBP06_23680 [Novosphingobium sp. BL-8H]|uniref:hypothetical protein n=1 Tax=Novosphingobium sp. BL-8H TaxID=3127640 RepID=UPI0037571B1D